MINRLSPLQKEILKIFDEVSVKNQEQNPKITRQEISKIYFSKPEIRRLNKQFSPLRRSFPLSPPKIKKGSLGETILDDKQKTPPEPIMHPGIEKKQSFTGDWKTRMGIEPFSSRFYSKKHDILRRNLKDLVKKGYLATERLSASKSFYQTTDLGKDPTKRR